MDHREVWACHGHGDDSRVPTHTGAIMKGYLDTNYRYAFMSTLRTLQAVHTIGGETMSPCRARAKGESAHADDHDAQQRYLSVCAPPPTPPAAPPPPSPPPPTPHASQATPRISSCDALVNLLPHSTCSKFSHRPRHECEKHRVGFTPCSMLAVPTGPSSAAAASPARGSARRPSREPPALCLPFGTCDKTVQQGGGSVKRQAVPGWMKF